LVGRSDEGVGRVEGTWGTSVLTSCRVSVVCRRTFWWQND